MMLNHITGQNILSNHIESISLSNKPITLILQALKKWRLMDTVTCPRFQLTKGIEKLLFSDGEMNAFEREDVKRQKHNPNWTQETVIPLPICQVKYVSIERPHHITELLLSNLLHGALISAHYTS